MTSTLRLRQICLVARALAPVVGTLEAVFDLAVCHRDPAVGRYGLENALFPVGAAFLEVVAPVTAATAAGRYLDRRGGDGGYMVITQGDDLEARMRRCAALGVRIANHIRYPDYEELQCHPRDVGGAILSFARQAGDDPDAWHPAGPAAARRRSRHVAAMVAAEIQGNEPERLAARWSDVLARRLTRDAVGRPGLALDDAWLRFVPAEDGRGDGLAGLDLACPDPGAVLAAARAHGLATQGRLVLACGVRFALVPSTA